MTDLTDTAAGTDTLPTDQAWASVIIPLPPEALLRFCQEDVVRLFKINPMLYFSRCRRQKDGSWQLRGRNISQQPAFEFDLRASSEALADGVLIRYQGGIKATTRFTVEPDEQGARLTITDDYSGLDPAERETRLGEVDRSLPVWAQSLHDYLRRWRRWSWCAPWRWYMRGVWQAMNPSGRRISYMLMWITAAEIIAFLLIFTIFWFEFDKYFPS